MLSISLLLVTLGALSSHAQLTSQVFGIPVAQWQCGAIPSHHQYTVEKIHENCPAAAEELNHCCAIHHDCFRSLRGLEFCNDHFCKCMSDSAKKVSAQCSQMVENECDSLNSTGDTYYPKYPPSKLPLTPLPVDQRHTPGIARITIDYKRLYARCPYQNGTFSSCATIYEICPTHDSKCVLKLVKCLDDTKLERAKDKKCDVAINRVINKLIELEEPATTKDPDVQRRMVIKNKETRRYVHTVALRSAVADSQMFIFLIAFAMFLLICVAAKLSYRTEEELVEVVVPDYSVKE